MDNQVFLQQNGFIWEQHSIAMGTYSLMANHAKPREQRTGTFVYRGKGEFRGAVINKESIGGSWEFEV